MDQQGTTKFHDGCIAITSSFGANFMFAGARRTLLHIAHWYQPNKPPSCLTARIVSSICGAAQFLNTCLISWTICQDAEAKKTSCRGKATDCNKSVWSITRALSSHRYRSAAIEKMHLGATLLRFSPFGCVAGRSSLLNSPYGQAIAWSWNSHWPNAFTCNSFLEPWHLLRILESFETFTWNLELLGTFD